MVFSHEIDNIPWAMHMSPGIRIVTPFDLFSSDVTLFGDERIPYHFWSGKRINLKLD